MERHGNHRLNLGQIHIDQSVVIRDLLRSKLFIIILSSVNLIEFPDLVIRYPDGRQTGRFGGHDIDADPVIHTQIRNTVSDKLHYLIIDIAVRKHGSDNRERNILRTDSVPGGSGQIDADHLRHPDIVCLIQQLLHQLRAAFSYRHGTKGSVTGMAV